MNYFSDPRLKQVGTPQVFARRTRQIYPTFFIAPAFCMVVAIYWAIEHRWTSALVFAASAIIYFPVSLLQYRSSKKICEEAIRQYQTWHYEQTGMEG